MPCWSWTGAATAVLLLAVGAAPAWGDDVFWNGGPGRWDDDSSWSTGLEPTSSDRVFIQTADADIEVRTDTATVQSLTMTAGLLFVDPDVTVSVRDQTGISGAGVLLAPQATLGGTATITVGLNGYIAASEDGANPCPAMNGANVGSPGSALVVQIGGTIGATSNPVLPNSNCALRVLSSYDMQALSTAFTSTSTNTLVFAAGGTYAGNYFGNGTLAFFSSTPAPLHEFSAPAAVYLQTATAEWRIGSRGLGATDAVTLNFGSNSVPVYGATDSLVQWESGLFTSAALDQGLIVYGATMRIAQPRNAGADNSPFLGSLLGVLFGGFLNIAFPLRGDSNGLVSLGGSSTAEIGANFTCATPTNCSLVFCDETTSMTFGDPNRAIAFARELPILLGSGTLGLVSLQSGAQDALHVAAANFSQGRVVALQGSDGFTGNSGERRAGVVTSQFIVIPPTDTTLIAPFSGRVDQRISTELDFVFDVLTTGAGTTGAAATTGLPAATTAGVATTGVATTGVATTGVPVTTTAAAAATTGIAPPVMTTGVPPVTPPPSPGPAPSPSVGSGTPPLVSPSPDAGDGDEDGFPLWLIILLACLGGCLLFGGIIACFIVSRRKKGGDQGGTVPAAHKGGISDSTTTDDSSTASATPSADSGTPPDEPTYANIGTVLGPASGSSSGGGTPPDDPVYAPVAGSFRRD